MLNASLLAGFVETFLRDKFDNPHPIPRCHFEWWEICTGDEPQVALAAPRGHAKSTAITHAFALAAMLFRFRSHAMIVSSSETMAMNFLKDISAELAENAALREAFGVERFIKDTESEIIVQLDTGRFRMIAKGCEQKIRGTKWRNKRPDLIICDDMEEDEQVENLERRQKLRNWFQKALLPCGGDNCLIRVVGTIMHDDSLLNNLLKDPMWESRRYRAHKALNDFTEILWPEKFPPGRLHSIQSTYRKNLSAYSQEYLNEPVAEGDQYFQPAWLLAMDDSDWRKPMTYYVVGDLAIGKDASHDYTALVVIGVDDIGRLYVVDLVHGRFDSFEIAERIFELYAAWSPALIAIEAGAIEKAVKPYINAQMIERRQYPNLVTVSHGNKDKQARAKPMQGALRAGHVRFAQETSWWPAMMDELTRFPRAAHDDIVDAFAHMGALLEQTAMPQTPDAGDDDGLDALLSADPLTGGSGRSAICGY